MLHFFLILMDFFLLILMMHLFLPLILDMLLLHIHLFHLFGLQYISFQVFLFLMMLLIVLDKLRHILLHIHILLFLLFQILVMNGPLILVSQEACLQKILVDTYHHNIYFLVLQIIDVFPFLKILLLYLLLMGNILVQFLLYHLMLHTLKICLNCLLLFYVFLLLYRSNNMAFDLLFYIEVLNQN